MCSLGALCSRGSLPVQIMVGWVTGHCQGLLLAKAGAVFPQLFFLSSAQKSGTFVTKL